MDMELMKNIFIKFCQTENYDPLILQWGALRYNPGSVVFCVSLFSPWCALQKPMAVAANRETNRKGVEEWKDSNPLIITDYTWLLCIFLLPNIPQFLNVLFNVLRITAPSQTQPKEKNQDKNCLSNI